MNPGIVGRDSWIVDLGSGSTPQPTIHDSRFFRYFDQILVRIAHVDRAQGEARPGAIGRPFLDRDAFLLEVRDHLIERAIGEEAQVERPGRRRARLDAGFETGRMDIELVVAEPERDAVLAVALDFHPQHARVEVEAALEVARRDDDVVESLDHAASSSESLT